MVLAAPVGVHGGVASDESGAVGHGDCVDGEARAHVRRDRVPDQFLGAEVEDGREVQPALAGREAGDVTCEFEAGHGCGELALDQVGDDGCGLVGLGEVPPFASGDPGQAVVAHESGDAASSDFDSFALEFAGDAFGTVGRVGGMDFSDPLQEFGFLAGSFLADGLGADPGAVVAAVGDQYAAQSPQAELAAVGVNEREAFTGRRQVDQRPRGLPQ